MNRVSADRLTQAETIFALFNPKAYPAEDFYQAWRNAILYDEHTWGAHNSISEPDHPFVKSQWAIKRQFAVDADAQSRQLIEKANGLYKSGTRLLLLDLTNLSYMSSSGIVALHSIAVLLHTGALPNLDNGWAALNAVAEESGGLRKEVKLFNPQTRVDRTLEISGMKQFLEIFTEFDTAVNSF